MQNSIVIRNILTGQPMPLGSSGVLSSMLKAPVLGPAQVTVNGIVGDAQADPKHHGGAEKALHHYPLDHYTTWRRDVPQLARLLLMPGAFGENLSVLGMTEETVCVGDIYQVGNCLLQVSQTRQPCWKLDVRFYRPGFARQVQAQGRTGWYYRVLQPGTVQSGTPMTLVERPHADWPLSRLLHFLYEEPLDGKALEVIAELEGLSPSMRKLAAVRLAHQTVENWDLRLEPPAGQPAIATPVLL